MFKFVGKKWLINYKDFENIQQKLENAGILVCDSDNYKWNIYMDKLDDYYIDTDKKLKKGQKANLGIADEIKKYKELLDSGAITQEEYDKKKKELLNIKYDTEIQNQGNNNSKKSFLSQLGIKNNITKAISQFFIADFNFLLSGLLINLINIITKLIMAKMGPII